MSRVRKFPKIFLVVVTCLAIIMSTSITSAGASPNSGGPHNFIKGVDASYVQRVEDKGGVYKTANGETADIFAILAANGVTHVRFRVWNDPVDGYSSKADVLSLSLRAKAAGLKIVLDFHYSDSWADPGQQNKPAAWESLNFKELNAAVFAYTHDVVKAMIRQGTPPDMIQVGNEITHGMLWPDGHVIMGDATYDTFAQWRKFTTLVKSAILGVKATGSRAKIMIHIASGDNAEMRWFFDNLVTDRVPFDVMGLSYYHNWHGTLSEMSANLSDMATRYRKPIIIAETAYPFTLGWNDWTNNITGLESQLSPDFPATPEGQTAFLQAVVDMTKAIPNNKGVGVFYWGGEWISTAPEDPNGSPWENQALFDFNSNAVQALDVFRNTP